MIMTEKNLLTEVEAMARACCAREDPSVYDPCIASRCMAWRWGPEIESFVYDVVGEDPPATGGWERYWNTEKGQAEWRRYGTTRGFCGRAGAP